MPARTTTIDEVLAEDGVTTAGIEVTHKGMTWYFSERLQGVRGGHMPLNLQRVPILDDSDEPRRRPDE